jgi:hypothetical protein
MGTDLRTINGLRNLSALYHELEAGTDIEAVLERAAGEAMRMAGALALGVWFERDGELHLVATDDPSSRMLPRTVPVGEGPIGTMFRDGLVAFHDPVEPDLVWVSSPVDVRSTNVGLLAMCVRGIYTEETLRLMRSVARALGTRLASELPQREEDSLRIVHGHEEYFTCLTREVGRARRGGYPLSLVILQLRGYLDAELLSRMSGLVRSVDDCFETELGEFALVMPHTSGTGAEIAADRIARIIEADSGGEISVWASVVPCVGDDVVRLDQDARTNLKRHPVKPPGFAA